jgi:hypothetical protein
MWEMKRISMRARVARNYIDASATTRLCLKRGIKESERRISVTGNWARVITSRCAHFAGTPASPVGWVQPDEETTFAGITKNFFGGEGVGCGQRFGSSALFVEIAY